MTNTFKVGAIYSTLPPEYISKKENFNTGGKTLELNGVDKQVTAGKTWKAGKIWLFPASTNVRFMVYQSDAADSGTYAAPGAGTKIFDITISENALYEFEIYFEAAAGKYITGYCSFSNNTVFMGLLGIEE